jgi:hypothetical protein
MPPNQAVSARSQRKINERRQQTPPLRDISRIILKKTRSLLGDCDPGSRRALAGAAAGAQLVTGDAASTPAIASGSIDLVVTSPPFLDVVDYAGDNWLRCWFCGIDPASVRMTIVKKIDGWRDAMARVFGELHRVLRPGGHVAFEVGEVRSGTVKLEQIVIPAALSAGLDPVHVVINAQRFTKTANCWGVDNNAKGTNSNRIVLLRKSGCSRHRDGAGPPR